MPLVLWSLSEKAPLSGMGFALGQVGFENSLEYNSAPLPPFWRCEFAGLALLSPRRWVEDLLEGIVPFSDIL